MVSKWEKEILSPSPVLTVVPPFGNTTTQVELSILKVRIKAVLDTGSPVNVLSYKLIRKLKLASDLTYNQSYGTSGTASSKDFGDYYNLPMRSGKLLITASTIV